MRESMKQSLQTVEFRPLVPPKCVMGSLRLLESSTVAWTLGFYLRTDEPTNWFPLDGMIIPNNENPARARFKVVLVKLSRYSTGMLQSFGLNAANFGSLYIQLPMSKPIAATCRQESPSARCGKSSKIPSSSWRRWRPDNCLAPEQGEPGKAGS